MLEFIKRKITHELYNKNRLNFESAKICILYAFIGILWIYLSDRIAFKISYNNKMLLDFNTYKGIFFVLITALILFKLINNLLKKVNLMENKLNENNEELQASNDELQAYVEQLTATEEELQASNEELQAYVEQLTAAEEELRVQYDKLSESEEKLRINEQKNSAIINAIPDLMFTLDKNGIFTDCMVSDKSKLYVPKDEFIGKSILDVIPKNISEIAFEKIQSVLKYETLEMFEYELQGQYFNLRMVKNNENEVLAISRDITIDKENEIQLKLSENKYKTLVDEMLQGVALYEGTSMDDDVKSYKLIGANRSHENLTGLITEKSIGKTIGELHSHIEDVFIEKLNNVVKTGESVYYQDYYKKTGYFHEVTAYRPQKLQLAVIVNDISEGKKLQQKLEYLSYHDQLTGLYNRRFFEEQLEKLNNEENLPLAIIMADVNGLKLINDTFGHVRGDELIKKVAEVIKNGCREQDIVARLAGDEFVVILPKTNNNEVSQVLDNIEKLTNKESVKSIDLSVSFGYEVKKNINENIIEVFNKAESNMYKKKLLESQGLRGKAVRTIMTTLHEKNKREENHSHRVSKLCEEMAQALHLSQDEVNELRTVGLLHDIGKIAIEEYILNKPGKLTEQEFDEIKRHPEIGYRILATVAEMSEMSEYVLAHHERWNGTGYPKQLKGEEIPIQSRIIAIVDTYDAMISERSYRAALSEEEAIKELKENAGIQFDEKLVRVFIEEVLHKSYE